jgi:hypothetical protein
MRRGDLCGVALGLARLAVFGGGRARVGRRIIRGC